MSASFRYHLGSLLLLVGALFSANTLQAQSAFPSTNALNSAWEASQKKLRDATVQLRDVLVISCKAGVAKDCDRAAVYEAQLILMGVAGKYHRAQRAASGKNAERFGRILEAADEAMVLVDDLAEALDE